MNIDTRASARSHALSERTKEVCGLVAIVKGRERYFPCRNRAANASEMFILDPDDYAAAEDAGQIIEVFHSHPYSAATASEADRVGCEKSGLPWSICNPNLNTWDYIEPCGFRAPLVGREWVWGLTDCWSLVRDWYTENGIPLRDWERPTDPRDFERAPFFDNCWKDAGFTHITQTDDLRRGDAVLLSLTKPGLDHVGVYVGDQRLLHHIKGRLSSHDIYGDWLQKRTEKILRHYDWRKLQHE